MFFRDGWISYANRTPRSHEPFPVIVLIIGLPPFGGCVKNTTQFPRADDPRQENIVAWHYTDEAPPINRPACNRRHVRSVVLAPPCE